MRECSIDWLMIFKIPFWAYLLWILPFEFKMLVILIITMDVNLTTKFNI